MSFKRPVVLCGPSGAGKSTLVKKLMEEYPGKFGFSISHTTRDPRPNEIDGVHYFFTEKKTMQKEIEKGLFIETAEVHGNLYGTSIQAVKKVQGKGLICILDIDVQGVLSVKKSDLNPLYIFVSPPSIEALEKRLRGRKTDSESVIEHRLKNALHEMEFRDKPGMFDHVVVNDDLDTAYEDLKTAIVPLF
eukprot:GCRY01000412.1.p1 GENE.GCRY01000412.1~~GCRY01000412.1.p1  ORF type:complete len:221 (-),score=36.44 GCRY01000412.1:579-1148(-)